MSRPEYDILKCILNELKKPNSVDFEFGCYSDGTTTIEGYSKWDYDTSVIRHYDMNNVELTGFDKVACSDTGTTREPITSEMCNIDGRWKVITLVNINDVTDILGPIFINPDGVPSTNPGDLVICSTDSGNYIVNTQLKCFSTGSGNIQVAGFEKRSNIDESIIYFEYDVLLSTDPSILIGDKITSLTGLTPTTCVSCNC